MRYKDGRVNSIIRTCNKTDRHAVGLEVTQRRHKGSSHVVVREFTRSTLVARIMISASDQSVGTCLCGSWSNYYWTVHGQRKVANLTACPVSFRSDVLGPVYTWRLHEMWYTGNCERTKYTGGSGKVITTITALLRATWTNDWHVKREMFMYRRKRLLVRCYSFVLSFMLSVTLPEIKNIYSSLFTTVVVGKATITDKRDGRTKYWWWWRWQLYCLTATGRNIYRREQKSYHHYHHFV